MVFVGTKGFDLAVSSVTEENEFYSMETKQFLAKFGGRIGYSIFAFEGCDLLRIGERSRKGFDIKGPGVDVRIDTEIRCCSVEESLGFLPALAGLEEL